MNPSTDTIHVTNANGNTVSVINGATCNAQTISGCTQSAAAVPVEQLPAGIAVDQQTDAVSTTSIVNGDVSRIDGRACTPTHIPDCRPDPIPARMGGWGMAIALDPTRGHRLRSQQRRRHRLDVRVLAPRASRRRVSLVMPQLLNKVTVIAALAGAAITGCGANSGPGAKVGAPVEPTTLTLGDVFHGTATPAVIDFVRDVDRDSHGALLIKLVDAPATPGDYEVRIVHGTAAGRWNLAWVGARVLDEVGVPDAGALQVPFLLDSYALEGAVVNGPIGAQLTREISHAGVVGVGLLVGQLRYFGTIGPVTSPASLVGRRMRTFDSASQLTGWRALHATPVLGNGVTASAIALMHDGRLFGIESDPSTYSTQNGIAGTTYTLGVPIWPRAEAIIAAPSWFESLPNSTRSLLRLAARQASAQSLADSPGIDATGIKSMCRSLHVVALDPAERAAFILTGKAVAAELARTEPNGALISEIERLKGPSAPQPAPAIPAACGASSTAAAPTSSGASRVARELAYALRPGTVYRAMIGFAITKQQLGLQQADDNAGTFTWRFSSGNRFSLIQHPEFPALSPPGPPATGTFKIHGDLIDATFNPPYAGNEVDRCSMSGTTVTCHWLNGNDGWTTKFGLGGMTTPLTLVRG